MYMYPVYWWMIRYFCQYLIYKFQLHGMIPSWNMENLILVLSQDNLIKYPNQLHSFLYVESISLCLVDPVICMEMRRGWNILKWTIQFYYICVDVHESKSYVLTTSNKEKECLCVQYDVYTYSKRLLYHVHTHTHMLWKS